MNNVVKNPLLTPVTYLVFLTQNSGLAERYIGKNCVTMENYALWRSWRTLCRIV